MTRLTSTMKWDVRLQWRNGFYYAAIVIVVVFLLIFSQVAINNIAWIMPYMLINNMVIGTFYFIGGLVLLEKGEGSLEARVTTPLRPAEYLTAKVATLTVLSLVESVLIVVAAVGFDVNWLFVLLGVTATGVFLCLVGFIAVVRYDSINEYLLPSILYMMLACLPLGFYLANWQHWLLYLHPVQAMLTLIAGGWESLPWWLTAYCLIYSSLWIALLAHLSLRAFHRFVITKQGVK
jgi:fluoroquinolone transport system permease protein